MTFCEHVCNGHDQRCKNRILIRCDARESENLRPVVNDGVDAGDLLQDSEADGNKQRAAGLHKALQRFSIFPSSAVRMSSSKSRAPASSV